MPAVLKVSTVVAMVICVSAVLPIAQVGVNTGHAEVVPGNAARQAALPSLSVPDLRTFVFVAEEKAVLPGQSQEKQSSGAVGPIEDGDRIGDLAVVSLFYQNSSYVDGRYNNNDFPVERGYVTDAEGTLRLKAFRIYPPRKRAGAFLASRHALSYRFGVKEGHSVCRLSQGLVATMVRIPASRIVAGADTLIRELPISELAGEETYVFVPDSIGMSAFAAVAPGVEAARLLKSDTLSVFQFNYAVQARVFDTKTGFPYGPSTHQNGYSYRRQYHGVTDAAGVPGVVWQDKANLRVFVTWFGSGLESPRTITLQNDRMEILSAACSGPDGALYYLTFQPGSGIEDGRARTAGVYKADRNGRPLAGTILDTSASALNAVAFDDDVASLAWSAGRLGAIFSRRMYRGADGLNHQGAIAVVLHADTLELIRNHGQTSGHSLDSVLSAEADGWFSGVDLGDNYPRGVHLHRFNEKTIHSAIAYTFKTEHGSQAASPAGRTYPPYTAISGGGKRYYAWSNDNRTYTELGGLVAGPEGYTIVFAGEVSPEGRSIDNARTGDYLVDPRNVGVVLVRRDFWNVPKVEDTLIPPGVILTSGTQESGGFYAFGGTWSSQNNYGVVWLTDYRNKELENASRIKAVRLEDGSLLVLWEKWGATTYLSTYTVRIDQYGRKLSAIIDLGPGVRLGRREEPVVAGSRVYLFGGDQVSSCLQLFIIELTLQAR